MDPLTMINLVIKSSFELQRRMDGVNFNNKLVVDLRRTVRILTGHMKDGQEKLQKYHGRIEANKSDQILDIITGMQDCLNEADTFLMDYTERKQRTGLKKLFKKFGDMVTTDNTTRDINTLNDRIHRTTTQWTATLSGISNDQAAGEAAYHPERAWDEYEERLYDELDTAAYWDRIYGANFYHDMMGDDLFGGSANNRKQKYNVYDECSEEDSEDSEDGGYGDSYARDQYGSTGRHPGSGRKSQGQAAAGSDSCEEESLQMPDFIVAKVSKVEQHPKSRRLRVCQLTLGPHHDAVQVVTSLLTVQADMLVIYMPVDTQQGSSKQRRDSYDDDGYYSDDYLYDGAPSSSQKLRRKPSKKLVEGVASVGRICTTVELDCCAGGDNEGKVAVEVPAGLFNVGKEFEQKDLATVTRELQMSKTQEELLEECWDVSLDPIAARVTSVKQHPKSNKLFVCQLDAGKEQGCVQVVTECKDIEEDMLVIYAFPGCPLSVPHEEDEGGSEDSDDYGYGYDDGYSDDGQGEAPEGPERAKKTIVAGVQTNGAIWSAEAAGWSDAPRAKQMVAFLPSDAVEVGEEINDEDMEYARKKWSRVRRR